MLKFWKQFFSRFKNRTPDQRSGVDESIVGRYLRHHDLYGHSSRPPLKRYRLHEYFRRFDFYGRPKGPRSSSDVRSLGRGTAGALIALAAGFALLHRVLHRGQWFRGSIGTMKTIVSHFNQLPATAQYAATGALFAIVALGICLTLWRFSRRERGAGRLRLDRRDLGWIALSVLLLLGAGGGTKVVVGSLNWIIFADQQTGSDMCAKIITGATAIQNGSSTASEIRVPAGTFVCTTQLLFPNDGGSPPRQKSIKLVGAGSGGLADNNSGTPNGGTVLDMQFSASTGKIDTRGLGKLEVTGINFKDSASDGTPFVFDTNTVISFHDNQFYGNCSDTTKQDVFILGGSTNTIGGGATAAFQGYGSVITINQADCVGRFAFLDVFANAIQIVNNHVFGNSGLTTGNGAAIELNPATSVVNGNYIAGNLIEMTGYVYGINLVKGSSFNTLLGNPCFDPGGSTVACINVGPSASNFGNQILDGNASPSIPPIHGNTVSLGLFTAINQCALHTSITSVDACVASVLSNGGLQVSGLFFGSGTDFTGSDIGPSPLVAAASGVNTYLWSCNGTATANTTLFLNTISTGALTCTDTGALGYVPAPSAGTINNLRCFANHAGVNASSGAVTVRKNGTPQTLTCTIGTGAACNDTTHSFSVAAGDLLTVQYTTQAAEVLASLACTAEKH